MRAALVTPHYGAGLEEIPAAEIPAAQPVPMPEIVAPEPEPLLAIPLPEVPEVLQDALQCPIVRCSPFYTLSPLAVPS